MPEADEVDAESEEWAPPFPSCGGPETGTPAPYGDLHAVSPFVATPQAAIDLIMTELNLGPQDFLIDLGCGQGTINITAAKKHRVKGLGVDIDPSLVEEASASAAQQGVRDLVDFQLKDVVDIDPALVEEASAAAAKQ